MTVNDYMDMYVGVVYLKTLLQHLPEVMQENHQTNSVTITSSG
jgi:hypothetical protein